MKPSSLLISLMITLSTFNTTLASGSLESVTVTKLPKWTSPYKPKVNQTRFNLDQIMKDLGISRVKAVEVQNHYKDMCNNNPNNSLEDNYTTAVNKVFQESNSFERFYDQEAVNKAKFIVVFDLDATLYDQHKAHEGCFDVAYLHNKQVKHIKLVPKWEETINRIKELGGAVIIFTANLDGESLRNLKHWQFKDGSNLLDSSKISGVFTNSHLVQVTKGRMRITEPSKDLRLFDESLEKVIIVDDNPTRLFQVQNQYVLPKFRADKYCNLSKYGEQFFDKKSAQLVRNSFDNLMPTVLKKIEDSVMYMNENKVSFRKAFLPYSTMGQKFQELYSPGFKDQAKIIEFIRKNSKIVDLKF